jgi:hypothetical protein
VLLVDQVTPKSLERETGRDNPSETATNFVPSADAVTKVKFTGTFWHVQVAPELVEVQIWPYPPATILFPSAEHAQPGMPGGTVSLTLHEMPPLVETQTPGEPAAIRVFPSADEATWIQ